MKETWETRIQNGSFSKWVTLSCFQVQRVWERREDPGNTEIVTLMSYKDSVLEQKARQQAHIKFLDGDQTSTLQSLIEEYLRVCHGPHLAVEGGSIWNRYFSSC